MRAIRTFFFHTLYPQVKTKWFFLPVAMVLYVSSFAWLFVSWLRNLAYDKKLLPVKKAPICVLSIGNIVVGGSGKTPFTIFLANHFSDIRSAILSRGYRSQAESKKNPTVVKREQKSPAIEIGDEPLLLVNSIPGAFVVVGKDRYKSALKAVKEKARFLILDDGMQHRQLFRNFDIVLVNGEEFLPLQTLLPFGKLRESRNRLSKADLIVVNTSSKEDIPSLKKAIARVSSAPVIVMKTKLVSLCTWAGEPALIHDKKIALFCSIANPERFERLLLQEGYQICLKQDHLDHEAIALADLQNFALKAKQDGARYLVCTEKDRVKYPESLSLALPILFTKIALEIEEGQDIWEKEVEKIRKCIYNFEE